MTTVSFISKKCAICGSNSRQAEIGMQGSMEPCDLDTRPSGAARSSIYMWVQCCSSCGYCAPDITKAPDYAKRIVESNEYQKSLKNHQLPDSLNHFLCLSMIFEGGKEFAQAGWAQLYAAWVCDDDSNIRDHSRGCRQEALRLFDLAQSRGQRFGENAEKEELLKIDILRRSGQFSRADELCQLLQEKELDKKNRHILYMQHDLIKERDAYVHTLGEALEDIN